MRISIGTKNNAKIEAFKETIPLYDFLHGAEVVSIEVSSDVSNQPKSLEETIRGAMNRAKNAFSGSDLSIGIESGLMHVPYSKSGFMDVCACALYDGAEYHLGLSSAWELPKEINTLMIEGGLDMSEAVNQSGVIADPLIGSKNGSVGFFTKGRVTRLIQTKQAIITALVHLENADLYKQK